MIDVKTEEFLKLKDSTRNTLTGIRENLNESLDSLPFLIERITLTTGAPIPEETIEYIINKTKDIIHTPQTLDTNQRRQIVKYGAILLITPPVLGAILNCVGSPKYNPNFSGPGREYYSFNGSIRGGWTPGIDWKVPYNTPVVAAARGKVKWIKTLNIPGHAGGQEIKLGHGDDYKEILNATYPFFSFYSHLNKVEDGLKVGDVVNRGQIIGYGGGEDTYNIVKFIVKESTCMFKTFVNPNKYGRNFGPPDYWDGKSNLEISDMERRRSIQCYAFKELYDSYKNPNKDKLLFKIYRKGYYGNCRWSLFDKFQYLEKEFEKNPQNFDINPTDVNNLKQRFYSNPVIILTIPFKAPKQ